LALRSLSIGLSIFDLLKVAVYSVLEVVWVFDAGLDSEVKMVNSLLDSDVGLDYVPELLLSSQGVEEYFFDQSMKDEEARVDIPLIVETVGTERNNNTRVRVGVELVLLLEGVH